jgi:hypothetical protein
MSGLKIDTLVKAGRNAIQVKNKPGEWLSALRSGLQSLSLEGKNISEGLSLNDLDRILPKANAKEFGALFHNKQEFEDYANKLFDNIRDAYTDPKLVYNKDNLVQYLDNSINKYEFKQGPDFKIKTRKGFNIGKTKGEWNFSSAEENFVGPSSPVTVPRPEPAPIVNNAPAQATENVIPKNAQQQAVQNTEVAQASANTTTPAPVNTTTSSTENVQTPKPAHPDSPYSSAYDNEGTIDDLYEETSTQAKVRAEAERSARESKQYWGTQKTEEEESWDLYNSNTRKKDKFIPRSQYGSQQEETPWSRGMKIALGTAVTGAALCAALSSSRGQQNNAQLYGQQPLY